MFTTWEERLDGSCPPSKLPCLLNGIPTTAALGRAFTKGPWFVIIWVMISANSGDAWLHCQKKKFWFCVASLIHVMLSNKGHHCFFQISPLSEFKGEEELYLTWQMRQEFSFSSFLKNSHQLGKSDNLLITHTHARSNHLVSLACS